MVLIIGFVSVCFEKNIKKILGFLMTISSLKNNGSVTKYRKVKKVFHWKFLVESFGFVNV